MRQLSSLKSNNCLGPLRFGLLSPRAKAQLWAGVFVLLNQQRRPRPPRQKLAAGLQRTTSPQFVELLAARRVCTDRSGDEGMSKASTALLEQGIQAPSPAPDLIPAETKKSTENLHWNWYSKRGHFTAITMPSGGIGSPQFCRLAICWVG